MPTQTRSLRTLHLTPEDLAGLSAALRKKLMHIQNEIKTAQGEWILVRAESGRDAQLVDKTMRALPGIAAQKRRSITEENIETLIGMLLQGESRAQVDEDLILDNANLRTSYLKKIPTLTAAKVRSLSGLSPINKSEPASRWKREGRIFAVRHASMDLFPGFQFSDGEPNPAIKKILKTLPKHLTPWQIALWFASGNDWLDGKAPQDCLNTPEVVLKAADRMNEHAIG